MADQAFETALATLRAERARLTARLEALEAAEQQETARAQALNATLSARRERAQRALSALEARLSGLAQGSTRALSARVQLRKGIHLMFRLGLTAVAFTTSLFFASADGRGVWLVPVVLVQGACVWWLGDLADREALK